MSEQSTAPVKRIIPTFNDIKNIKKNWNTVKSSPYASLQFALIIRKMIVTVLIVYILFIGFGMVKNYNAIGYMSFVGKIITIGVILFICWKIYETIPIAKKQLEYYKRNPKTINRKELNTKAEIDEILNMFNKKTGEKINTNERRSEN